MKGIHLLHPERARATADLRASRGRRVVARMRHARRPPCAPRVADATSPGKRHARRPPCAHRVAATSSSAAHSADVGGGTERGLQTRLPVHARKQYAGSREGVLVSHPRHSTPHPPQRPRKENMRSNGNCRMRRGVSRGRECGRSHRTTTAAVRAEKWQSRCTAGPVRSHNCVVGVVSGLGGNSGNCRRRKKWTVPRPPMPRSTNKGASAACQMGVMVQSVAGARRVSRRDDSDGKGPGG